MALTSVRLDDDLLERLDAAAAGQNHSRGRLIRDAVEEYLARLDRNARMLRETDEALADIEAGQIVDGDQVLKWLASWGQADELPPPSHRT